MPKESFDPNIYLSRLAYKIQEWSNGKFPIGDTYANRPRLQRFVKFSLIAFAWGYVINLLLTVLFIAFLGYSSFGLAVSMLLAAIIVHVTKFIFNDLWTWKAPEKKRRGKNRG